MYVNFSTAISSVFVPKVHRIVQKNEKTMDIELTNLFIKVGRLQFIVIFLILSGFIFFGQYFILKWAGTEYKDAYYIAILLIAPVTIPLIQNIGIEIQRAKNKHQFRSIVYLIMAILNVGISIWFCYLWGAIGCAIGTTISLLIANGLIMNIYYHKKLGINIIEFWKSIFSILPSLIIPIGLGVILLIYAKYESVLSFLLYIALYTFVYIIFVVFLGLNKEEKAFLTRIIKKVFRKK
jgi:O-antigen/teichoic acid export membrane protein